MNTSENLCIHSLTKTECKRCKYRCIHNKEKSRCRDCGGSAFCIHNKLKQQCKECGGSRFCIHNRVKTRCKECGGSSFCIHNKLKEQCRDCGGSAYCIHNKIKSYCRDCGGCVYCIHNKRKSTCKDCNGSGICIHNKIKSSCKECGGSEICIHSKFKSTCKECGGSRICIHNKFKQNCKECGGSQLCKSTFCETYKNKKYNGYCCRCYIHLFPDEPISRNYKTKEFAVLEFIRNNYLEHTWVNDKTIDGGCSKKRPDIFLDLLTHSIIIEIDENQHKTYDNCELKRINLLFEDLGDRYIVFIRFNPDDYLDKDNKKITSCWGIDRNGLSSIKKSKKNEWEQRLNTLKNTVDEVLCIDNIDITNPITYINLFYDEEIVDNI